MAFKQGLIHKFFNVSKRSEFVRSCRVLSASSAARSLVPPEPDKFPADQRDETVFRRFLHRRPFYHSTVESPEMRSLPTGERLMERLREMDIVRERLRLDGLRPPATAVAEEEEKVEFTVEDARKVLRVSQLEAVKSRLKDSGRNYVSMEEFLKMCGEGCGGDDDEGRKIAKTLDDSGTVIVLGNVVYLKPQQVVKAIHGLMPASQPDPNDPRMKELDEMEKQKLAIDKKAEAMVRRELWCGLGYLVVQTAAFMRLTFWELSWDVMEPICFYVTSFYFMLGYAFFLRTSKEPSFEGFFQSRFSTKQKRLMKLQGFDIERYYELLEACYPHPWPREKMPFATSSLDFAERTESYT